MGAQLEEQPVEALEVKAPMDEAVAKLHDEQRFMYLLATDKNVDMEKMQQAIAMMERAQDRAAEAEFTRAFAAMQGDLPEIQKLGESNNGKFAKFEHVQRALRPILQEHGFALSFRTPESKDGTIGVTARLSHVEGHYEETTMYAPLDKSGNKSDIHAMASTTSYLKRYTAGALLNIIAVDEDDDGNAAGSAGSEEPAEPEGYDRWIADMESVADNGVDALRGAWERSSKEYQAYATEHELERWLGIKAAAEQAQ